MSPPDTGDAPLDVQVTIQGDVPAAEVEHARRVISTVAGSAPRPVTHATCHLHVDGDPACTRPYEARATLDVSGRQVCAHVAAEEMRVAIDQLRARLARRLTDLASTQHAWRHRTGRSGPDEWRHGDVPADRPGYFPRPVDERRLVTRTTYSPDPIGPDEAAWELHMLDERFHLYTDDATEAEAVVYLRDDGAFGLLQAVPDPGVEARLAMSVRVNPSAAPRLTLDAARTVLDYGEATFVFYVDPVDERRLSRSPEVRVNLRDAIREEADARSKKQSHLDTPGAHT